MTPIVESPFSFAALRLRAIALPFVTVVLGSAMGLIPVVADTPLTPDFGLLMLIAWRLPRPGLLPAWAGIPLGLAAEAISGHSPGSAICFWTLTLLVMDFFDSQLLWRDYLGDWLGAAAAIAACLLGGWMAAALAGGGGSPFNVLPQIGMTVLLYPLAARLCAQLDRLRWLL